MDEETATRIELLEEKVQLMQEVLDDKGQQIGQSSLWFGTTIPDNYIELDSLAYRRLTYPELYEKVSGRLDFENTDDGFTTLDSRKLTPYAWCSFNMAGGIVDQYNIASITKISNSQYDVYFRLPSPDTSYCVITQLEHQVGVIAVSTIHSLFTDHFNVRIYANLAGIFTWDELHVVVYSKNNPVKFIARTT